MVRLPCVPVLLSVFLTVTATAGPTDYQAAILHPSGLALVSDAWGISGGWQVDYRTREERALLWSGTADSVVDVHPGGFSSSYAYGVAGGQQAGAEWPKNPLATGWHILPWLGTAESAINLHLNGFTDLRAYGIGLGLRAGWGWSANEWFDTTESVLGLQSRSTHSVAEGTLGRQQINYRELSDTWGIEYALLWSGTVIDTPTANGNNVTARRDMPVSTILASGDPDGDLPTCGLAAAPSHGSLSGTEPNLTYTADTNFNGSNRLVFEAEAAEAKPTNLKEYIGVGIGVFALLGGLTVALAKGQKELKKTMLHIVGAVRSTIRSKAQSKESSPKISLATLPERILQNRKTPIMQDVGGLLEVVITEAESKKPVEKAGVSIRHKKTNQLFTSGSDLDGIARIHLMSGEYQMQGICRQGFTSARCQETITIEHGRTARIEWQLVGKPKTTGVVRNVDTRQAKKAKTERRGRSKPYGFFEGEKKLIKRIEQLHQKPKGGTHLGPYQIARILNREGWPTRKATEWRGSQVSAILKRLGPKPARKGPEHS